MLDRDQLFTEGKTFASDVETILRQIFTTKQQLGKKREAATKREAIIMQNVCNKTDALKKPLYTNDLQRKAAAAEVAENDAILAELQVGASALEVDLAGLDAQLSNAKGMLNLVASYLHGS